MTCERDSSLAWVTSHGPKWEMEKQNQGINDHSILNYITVNFRRRTATFLDSVIVATFSQTSFFSIAIKGVSIAIGLICAVCCIWPL